MCIVDSWKDAPKSVHLRVVLVDFGHDEKERSEEQRERAGGY